MAFPSGSGTDRDSDTTASESDTDTASSTGSDSEADTTFPQRPGASQRDVSPNANNMAEQIAGALATAKTAKSDTSYVPLTAQKYKPLSQLTTDQEHTEFPKHGSQVSRKKEDSDEEDESDSDSESDSNSDSSSREDTIPGGQRAGGMVVAIENKSRSKFPSLNLPL